jgi:hypothetical protein
VLQNPTVASGFIADAIVAVPLSDVERMETQQFSGARTIALIVSVPVVFFAYGLLWCATHECD